MDTILVGSFDVKKGVEYSGFVPYGNAFITTEKVKVSINRCPFAYINAKDTVITKIEFTYTFENDTSILFSRENDYDNTTIWNSKCSNNISLVKDTESEAICSLTTAEDVNTGNIICIANIVNDNDTDANITINLKIGAMTVKSLSMNAVKNNSTQIVLKDILVGKVDIGSIITFSLKSDTDNIYVDGIRYPSQIQITKET